MLDDLAGAVENGVVTTRVEMETCLDGVEGEDTGLADYACSATEDDVLEKILAAGFGGGVCARGVGSEGRLRLLW